MYSIAFERQLSNDMGLKSLELLGVFTLFNAITIDFFHSEGKTNAYRCIEMFPEVGCY